jgi:hypothetical protein
LNGHTDLITFLNRIYSLVHIPGTVTLVLLSSSVCYTLADLIFPASSHGITSPLRPSPTSPPSAAP